MPSLYTTIGPWTFPTFNLVLTLAALVSAGIALRTTRKPGMVADVYLGALAGGVLGARLFHVLLNMDYFADHLHEAVHIHLGGLDWHGAALGGLMGLYAAMRARRWLASRAGEAAFPYTYADLLDGLTPALPLFALAGWWGCLAASCGYGLEVDNLSNYPPLMVAETADVYGIAAPRYNTQLFGLLLGGAALLLVIALFWRGWLRYRRFWFTLALLSAGMFVIGFTRGDAVVMVGGLRGDQWLDGILVVAAALAVSRQQEKGTPR